MRYSILKRFFDIIVSCVLIILTFPLLLIILLITYLDIGRPLIDIRIPREGKNKNPFYMYKIRTRIYDKNGSHYSKISKIIDNKGLNELPQLFNVLLGDMSFIGPRAFICGEELPSGNISSKRYKVKPGIIGLAYSKGGRRLGFKETLRCDIEYYDNFSLKQDVKIFNKCIILVLKRILGR